MNRATAAAASHASIMVRAEAMARVRIAHYSLIGLDCAAIAASIRAEIDAAHEGEPALALAASSPTVELERIAAVFEAAAAFKAALERA